MDSCAEEGGIATGSQAVVLPSLSLFGPALFGKKLSEFEPGLD
jgi:hypothetical protein